MADDKKEGRTVEMISPSDYRVYRVPVSQLAQYEAAGYVDTQPAIRTQQIKEHFSGWKGLGHSFLLSTIAGVPFARSAIAGLSEKADAQAWKESFDAAAREHPIIDFLGRTAGTVGTIGGLVATGGALGIGGAGAAAAAEGAEAAGVGAGLAGEGAAAATGEAAAGAATTGTEGLGFTGSVEGLGGKQAAAQTIPDGASFAAGEGSGGGFTAADTGSPEIFQSGAVDPVQAGPSAFFTGAVDPAVAGVEGVGAEAAGTGAQAGAGVESTELGATAIPDAAAATAKAPVSLTQAAAKAALGNMTLGHIARIDDSALAHAADPEGKEKIQWGLNEDDLLDAAFGAAVPIAAFGLGKTLSYAGRKLDTGGMSVMQRAMTKAGAMDSIERQGRTAEVFKKLEQVVNVGRKNPGLYAKQMFENAGKDMQDVVEQTRNYSLSVADTDALKADLYRVLGKDNRLYPRAAEELNKQRFNIEIMKGLNEKIYAEINFDEPELRKLQDSAYMKAAERVKNGMSKIFQSADPSADQAIAQRWASANKEYSAWTLAYSAVKKGETVKGIGDMVSNVTSNAATGFLSGLLFNGFGGPGAALANSAAYGAVRSLSARHYGQVARYLGAHFLKTDARLAAAIEAGLWGAPWQVHQLHTRSEYQDVASKLSAVRADPQTAFVNTRTSMTERGYPEDVADHAALGQHAQTQWLASKLPKRMTAPDVVSKGQGDPVQQRRLLGQYKTMRDPTYGLLYPNKTNMEVLLHFYPNILANAQQAILSQLQRNPNIPSASKQWASRVLGRPMSNLSSPSFSSMLQTNRQRQAEQEQQQGQQMGPSPSKRTQSPAQGTRLDQLQGGDQ